MHDTLLNLTILASLLFLLGSVERLTYDRRMRLWSFGWIALVLHLLLYSHVWKSYASLYSLVRDGFDLFLLTLAGIAFLISFLPRTSPRQTLLIAVLMVTPCAALIVLTLALPQTSWLIGLSVLAGETLTIVMTRRILPPSKSSARLVTQSVAILLGGIMLVVAPRLPQLIPYLVLSQIFLLAAEGLRDTYGCMKTRGCIATFTGLVLWAFVLPLKLLLAHLSSFQAAATNPLWDLWEVPLFLTAFGMVLILLEEDTRRSAARAEDYRQLFDCHPLPMYIYNTETLRFLRANEAVVEKYGYSYADFAAMSVMDIRPASEVPRLQKFLSSENRSYNVTQGWRHTLKNGRVIDVDIYRHSLRFEGQPCNLVVAVDVTQRNAAEQRLRQTYKLESLGQLTGGIAHDFNNLLAILMGSLELVDRENPQPQSRALVQQAILSVRRGVALTRRLLAYSRHQPESPGPISIPSLVDSIAGFLKTSVGSAIELEITFEPGLWQAAIDPNQLENAILNLTLNARDAMPGGGTLHIHARNCQIEHNQTGPFGEIGAGDYVLLSLDDTGTGMPPHILARATEPFFTTKSAGEGTGLGLSMVQGFLQQSGGSLQIESSSSTGTRMLLYLPRAQADPSQVAVPERIANQAIPRGTESILLVEDDAAIRKLLVICLSSLGYAVCDTGTGPDALEQLARNPAFALLLTDVILSGGIDGRTLAERARSLRPGLRVLYSSGYSRDILVADDRIDPEADLLTKPYQVAELAQCVRRTLDHAAATPEEASALS